MRNSDKYTLLLILMFELFVMVPLCYGLHWSWQRLSSHEIYDVYSDPVEFMDSLRKYVVNADSENSLPKLEIASEYIYKYGPYMFEAEDIGGGWYGGHRSKRVSFDTLSRPVRVVRQEFIKEHPDVASEELSLKLKWHNADSIIEFYCYCDIYPIDCIKLELVDVTIYKNDLKVRRVRMNSPDMSVADSRHYAILFADSILGQFSSNIHDRQWESFLNRFTLW